MPRYRALYDALTSNKLEVRVLPDTAFGLIHGKAGVLRYADGTATAFMGSVNESLSAWKLNYELLWEDNDPEPSYRCRRSLIMLWNDPRAVDLACCPFIVRDVQRIITRTVIEPAQLPALQTQRKWQPLWPWRSPGVPPRARPVAAPEILRPAGARAAPPGRCTPGAGRPGGPGQDGTAWPWPPC